MWLGFSWASGIVTIAGRPYPNGRNQESSSEAIHAYEAVALYGDVMVGVFEAAAGSASEKDNSKLFQTKALDAYRVKDIGRLLMATEG